MNEILKQIDCGEVAVIAGITVVSTGICILCPPATPWVIAGGVAAGALAEGGMEVYKESKTGEYDWVKILTKTLGGGLKGALAASPLKPLATGVGVATTGEIEEYIYCIANGETHEQALKSAAINGPIEGLTVGGCKWLGNAVSNKIKAKKLVNNRSDLQSMTESEPFLLNEFYEKRLPNQVKPGIKYLPKYDGSGKVIQIKMYDNYGREVGWVDYTNHGNGNVNGPDYHTNPHWNEKIYNEQYREGMKVHHRTDVDTPLGRK